MNVKQRFCFWLCTLSFIACSVRGQGTFQNLDFENGNFIPIQGNPFFVEPGPALPGWTAYVGTNLAQQVLHNTVALSTAAIAVYGPDNPSADYLHGHYFLILQTGLDPFSGTGTVTPSLAQSGTIPLTALSIRLLNGNPFSVGTFVYFNGTPVPLHHLASNSNGSQVWGGDVSSFRGQSGELRLLASDYLDFIQFSDQPIPEPSVPGLFVLGAVVIAWQLRTLRHSKKTE